jgi:nitrogen fixation/metabolism regulation signal transduction histidine kinase
MNNMAYRVLALPAGGDYIGRPFSEVLVDLPEVVRVLQQAFDSSDLPNRAEMRLRKTGRAMGYTLSHIHDDDGRMVGATLFFKDLTRVEQMEERERLRDRLAALGEMAAAIAHEVKNPLASIEVMAGVLKRQMTDREEALETLNDIIKEAKMANAIVVEVLEFVRPIQLQVERASLDEVLKDSIHARRRQDAARLGVDRHRHRAGRARAPGRSAPASPALFQPARERLRGARRRRPRRHSRVAAARRRGTGGLDRSAAAAGRG